jgi:hypothetical protein
MKKNATFIHPITSDRSRLRLVGEKERMRRTVMIMQNFLGCAVPTKKPKWLRQWAKIQMIT